MPAPKMTSYAMAISRGGTHAPVSWREMRVPVNAPRMKAAATCERADLRRRARKYGAMILLFIFQGANSLSIAAPLSQRGESAPHARSILMRSGGCGDVGEVLREAQGSFRRVL